MQIIPTLYPNGFPSAYEELKTFYPVFYRDVFEMDAIWKVCGGKLDEIESGVDAVANSAFVATMPEAALAQMEIFLGIPPDASRSLEDRRKLVGSFFIGTGHIGAPEIKEIARKFSDGECEVTFEKGVVSISIKADIDDAPLADDFYYILRKKIPAHLGINTDSELEFSNTLYFGGAAAQNDRYTVKPAAAEGRVETTGRIYAGGALVAQERLLVLPIPEYRREAKAALFAATAATETARVTVLPAAAAETTAQARYHAAGAAVEYAHYIVR